MMSAATIGLLIQGFGAAALVTLPLAWRLGRGPERVLALALAASGALALTRQAHYSDWIGVASFRPDYALIDTIALICIGAAALHANRFYPLVMASAALIPVLAHLLRWPGLFEGGFSYLLLITIPTVVMAAAYWTGLALHVRRERQFGRCPDWRGRVSTQMFAASGKLG